MAKWSELTGNKYHHLTVIYPLPDYRGGKVWRCSCYCGKYVTVQEKDLFSGVVSSCGCLPPIIRDSRWYNHKCYRHGKRGSTEYRAWASAKQRCTNPNNQAWKDYGGRGIKMHPRWLKSFKNFIDDMGMKPDPVMSIDRIDNDGDYEPGNCRWATPKQQTDNRRT